MADQGPKVTLMVCDGCHKPTEIRDWPATFPEDAGRLCRCECVSASGQNFIPQDHEPPVTVADLAGRGVRQREPVQKSKSRDRRVDQDVIEAKARFREGVFSMNEVEFGKVRCIREGEAGHVCTGRLDPHHVVPRRAIAVNHSTFRLDKAAKLELEYNPDNGVVICRGLHDAVTDGSAVIWRHEVPERTEAWARDNSVYALPFLLDRECPDLHGPDEPDPPFEVDDYREVDS